MQSGMPNRRPRETTLPFGWVRFTHPTGIGSRQGTTARPVVIAMQGAHCRMDRTPQRRERIRRRLKTDRVDGLLVLSESNVRYLTGFTGDSSALLLTRERVLVISDG